VPLASNLNFKGAIQTLIRLQLNANRSTGFLLDDGVACLDLSIASDVADPMFHQIAACCRSPDRKALDLEADRADQE